MKAGKRDLGVDYFGNPLVALGNGASEVLLSPKQVAADNTLGHDGRYSCLVGGTRSGKTFLVIRSIVTRALAAPNGRHVILRFRGNAAKRSIALDTLPTVMRKCFPGVKYEEHKQDGYFSFENGSEIWIGGLDDKERVDKILGLEFVTIFLNEASEIPYSSALIAWTRLAQVVPGLRQRGYVDLNPTGRGHWTNILFGDKKDPMSGDALVDPKNYERAFLNPVDNAHNLAKEFLKSLETLPAKQKRRFFEGVYVDEVEGAFWSPGLIGKTRVDESEIPESARAAVVVSIDPSGAKGSDDTNKDEIGIIVAARGANGHGYILKDFSRRCGPAEWARVAVEAFHNYRADCIVAEGNFGGAMVESTIKAADKNVPVKMVTASRGKAVRAEPIATRYENGEVHHVGQFPILEEQLCEFSPAGYGGTGSPDHADAAVWALTYLLGTSGNAGFLGFIEEQSGRSAEKRGGWFGGEDDIDLGYETLRIPDGCSVVYGLSGRRYTPVAGGVISVLARDAGPLRAAGFMSVAA
jgi:hypothetical protein